MTVSVAPLGFARLTPDGATDPVDRPLAEEMPVAIEYTPGDRLIVEGTDKVQPDATVKPVPVASAQ